MAWILKAPLFLFLVWLPVAASLSAQVSGDCVVIGHHIGPVAMDVSWIKADGSASGGMFSSSAHSGGAGLTQAPGNDGVVFTGMANLGRSWELYHYSWWGNLTTFKLPAPLDYTPTILVDQNGDLLLLNQTRSPATSGIFRMPFGATAFSTLVTGFTLPVAMEEDLVTGDFLVADAAGDVHRVTRAGTITSVTRKAFPAMATGVRSKMHTFFSDGSVLATWTSYIFKFDPMTGTVTTLLTGGTNTFVGLDHDAVNGLFDRGDAQALVRYDPATGKTVPIRQFGMYSLSDVATWGGRILSGTGACRPGAPYPIHLSLYSEAGRAYLAAASFGALSGIPTPAGRVPLDPDPLFFLSMSAPALFSGFTGWLSRSGTARLTVNLPNLPNLQGKRFFVAMVTYDGKGIRKISEPLGITIE